MKTKHGAQCRRRLKTLTDEMLTTMEQVVGEPRRGSVTVTRERVVAPLFEEADFVCSHGVRYWVAPDEELQRWLLTMTDQHVARWNAGKPVWLP